jgi:hypothetical protein
VSIRKHTHTRTFSNGNGGVSSWVSPPIATTTIPRAEEDSQDQCRCRCRADEHDLADTTAELDNDDVVAVW